MRIFLRLIQYFNGRLLIQIDGDIMENKMKCKHEYEEVKVANWGATFIEWCRKCGDKKTISK